MTLYAAYGGNLDPARMSERCPHSPLQSTGWLTGWRLTFGGEEHGWDGALSTIVQDPFEQVFVAVDEGTPDPSWIYGSDLSRVDHVDVLTGTKAWQLATRFAYSEIPVHTIEPELAPALATFLALPKPSRGVKTMIVNYEQMMLVRKQLGYLELEGGGA